MPPHATILVVEDNAMNMELTCDLLEVAGYRVLQAVTAETGLPMARAEKPDLILMDIALPGMNGMEATRMLKADPQTRAIPIVALTASAMRSDEQRALEAGCLGVIQKPLDTRAFAARVAAYMNGARAPSDPS